MSRLARFTLVLSLPALIFWSLLLGASPPPVGGAITSRTDGNGRERIVVQRTATPPIESYLPVVLRDDSALPGFTPTPTRTLSPFNYTLQGPVYLANFANSAGCNWMGIAGQAFDLAGRPVIGLLVHLEGGGLNVDTITGSKPEYGTGGYEFFLNNYPIETVDTYRIQLRTFGSQPLSDTYVIPTFADCNRNLVLADFVQNH